MRVALMGAGRIGRLHARLLKATAGIDSVVVGDVDNERAADVARTTGIESASSIEAAFEGVDAVVIAAATSAHAELIREAIRRGMPTFCEKPLASPHRERRARHRLRDPTRRPRSRAAP